MRTAKATSLLSTTVQAFIRALWFYIDPVTHGAHTWLKSDVAASSTRLNHSGSGTQQGRETLDLQKRNPLTPCTLRTIQFHGLQAGGGHPNVI